MKSAALTAGLAAILGLALSMPLVAQTDPIETRQALMKNTGETAFGIFKGQVSPLDGAQRIVDNLSQVGSLFPEGSQGGNALTPVWSDREGFEAALANAQQVASTLLTAAQSGDQAAFNAAFMQLDGACSNCHDDYRKPLD